MANSIPPSQRRLREARAAGLRPRAPTLHLAGAALLVWAVFELLATRGPGWLAAALAGAFHAARPGLPGLTQLATGAWLVLAGATAVAWLIVGRRRRPRSVGVPASLGEIPVLLALVASVLGLVVMLAMLRPAMAGAARAVDAPSLDTLWALWSTWLRRALLSLALVMAGLGLVERLVSGRRLWQGLHLTREQAREQARATSRRR